VKHRGPAEQWHELLRPLVKDRWDCQEIPADVRAAKLTFGRRVHCPFLRPYFLSPADEQRVGHVAETIAAVRAGHVRGAE